MKHISFKYSDKTSLKNTKKLAQKDLYKTQLIQLFTALTDKKEIQKILQKLKKYFPKAHIIGTTTAGEISNSKMYDNTTVVSVSLFTSTTLQTAYVKNINKKSGEKISNLICSKKTKASIILSEGLHLEDYEGFIKGIKKQNPQLIIAGGLAGDNFLLEKTYIFLGTDIYENGAVGVSFSGKKLYATNKYNLNWTPIGKTFRITSSDGNLIHTIDNEPALKVF